jgi:uncharacterized protein (TIGR03083 family)
VNGAPLRALGPTATVHLFRPLGDELVRLIRGLSNQDWLKPTVAPDWRVRDVVAHLLDGQLRNLSLRRDGHRIDPGPITSYGDLVGFINRLNDTGVRYGDRLSPSVMITLLEMTGPAMADYLATLPPDGEAVFSVAWAGESRSTHWMDIAREYTEWWHHQMQIRDAVGAPLLLAPAWFDPLLDTSVRALPVAYREVNAVDDTSISIAIRAERPRHFALVRSGAAWQVLEGTPLHAAATVTCDADTAWRLFFNALSPAAALERLQVEGERRLIDPLLRTRSVMV